MNWIDLSSDKKARAARLSWRSRKLLKNWNYDEEGQSILNRIIEHSIKGKSWKPYINRPLKPKGRWKTRGGRDQDWWRGQQGNKERSRRKCREVFRLIELDWNYIVNMRVRERIGRSMVLVLNPDCDFVKGGES